MNSLKYTAKSSYEFSSTSPQRFEEHKTAEEENRKLMSFQEVKQLFIFSGLFYVFMMMKQFKVNFLGTMSRVTGKFAWLKLPKFILVPLLKIYSALYGVDLDEMELRRLWDFSSFNHFFTRKLKNGIRNIADKEDPWSVCSPCDGTVYNYGDCQADTFVVVKDTPYRIDEFLFGKEEDAHQRFQNIAKNVKQRGNSLKFILFYLSPADYHRYHSAALCSTDFRRHIAGKLYPVKPSYVAKHPNVFKENERVALCGEWANGFFSTTFIGATNVGSIVVNFDKDLKTNLAHFQGVMVKDRLYSTPAELECASEKNNALSNRKLNDDVIDTISNSGSSDDRDISTSDSITISDEHLQKEQSQTCSPSESYPCRTLSRSSELGISTESQITRCSSDVNSEDAFDFTSYHSEVPTSFVEAENQRYGVTSKGIILEKGQEIGYFNLGSSIMLIFEAPHDSHFEVEVGQKVKLGNSILKVNKSE